MATAHEPLVHTIWRRRRVQDETGMSRSGIYLAMARGLFPKVVRLGPHTVGWLAVEITKINAARVAGCSDAEIRELVLRLEAARSTALDRACPPSAAAAE